MAAHYSIIRTPFGVHLVLFVLIPRQGADTTIAFNRTPDSNPRKVVGLVSLGLKVVIPISVGRLVKD